MPVAVEGMRELSAKFAAADRQSRLGLRHAFQEVAEPVRADAESLAAAKIPRIGARWARMRTGVTRTAVYVAPRQRGVRGRDPARARPNLAGLLMERAMQPALDQHEAEILDRVEQTLERVAADFNH